MVDTVGGIQVELLVGNTFHFSGFGEIILPGSTDCYIFCYFVS